MRPYKTVLLLCATLTMTACAHARQPGCAAPADAKSDISQTVQNFFEALRTDDEAAFRRLTTESFYSFDVGKRYEGTELADAVRDAHAKGVQINWTIGPVDTKLSCNVAWSAWQNDGSAGVPPDLQPVRWLESAVLVRENGSWKIDFFHSQRAAEK